LILSNFTLLVVEDDLNTQKYLKEVLESEVKEYISAYDGKEGLKLFLEKKPDIILADIIMPELCGLKMINEIKKVNPRQNVLIISAKSEKETLLEAIELGVDSFIIKPLNLSLLLEKLNKTAKEIQHRNRNDILKEIEIKKLQKLAHYDPLTNLPNRTFFEQRMKEVISSSKRNGTFFALFFVDLDNFKNINDTFGHTIGDKILKHTAKNLKSILREEDFVARISGDEFCVIIEHNEEHIFLESIAKKIINAVSIPLKVGLNSIKTTCSIGICKSTDTKSSNIEDLFNLSDKAMYVSKKLGKNRYTFGHL